MGMGGQCHTLTALPLEKRPGTHCIGGWVVPSWTGAKNLAFAWIQSPDHPAHSNSLYQLCYPGPCDTVLA
jgi:hypothetical protein